MPNILDELLEKNINILNVAAQIAPNGKIEGSNWVALCPFHNEKTASYKIDIHTGLSYCFGCGHKGDIIADYAKLNDLSLLDAKKELLNIAPREKKPQQDSELNTYKQLEKAKIIWNKSISDTQYLKRYFRTRGLKFRQYPSIKLYQGTEAELYGNNKQIPIIAMVSKITDAYDNLKSLHITELAEKNGKIERGNKRFFRGLPVAGSFVTFGDISKTQTVAIAEGVETALSVKEALPNFCILASLSASFMPSIILPSHIRNVYIFADNDNAGLKASAQLQKRLEQEGKKAIVIAPKERGRDFNDTLRNKGVDAILQAFTNAQIPKEKNLNKKFSVLKGFSPKPIAKFLKEKCKIFVDSKKIIWLFNENEGIWNADADNYIKAILRNEILSDELSKKYVISEVIEELKDSMFKGIMFPEAPLNLLPFGNGVYDMQKNTLLPFDSSYYLTFKLPIAYNPNAKPPEKFLQFLEDIYDDPEELLEVMAYTLYRSYPYQKIIFLYGSGGNGKSTFLSILSTLLGRQNISSVSLKKIIENRFMASQLHQKLANISADEPSFKLTASDDIKNLTGGDIITAERKNQNPFQFKNFAKLIVSTNHLPPTTDRTPSFYRRVHLIKFTHKFEGRSEKRDLALNIINDTSEMEGIARIAVEQLKKLYERKFYFKNYQNSEKIAKEYERLSNPVETFVETFTTFSSNPEHFVTKKEFKQALNIYLNENNLQPMSDREISKTMNSLGFKDRFAKQNNKTKRVWLSIKWIDEVLEKLLKRKGTLYLFAPKEDVNNDITINPSEFLENTNDVPF